jgi:cytochrome c biogenesis protein
LRSRVTTKKQGLNAAERAFKHLGLKTERIVRTDSFSLFSERSRISEMAVYIVHASLLLIFTGFIVDSLYGWRGFLMLTPGTASNQVEMKDGSLRTIPFSIRCDGTGEETYADGTPKKWWSKLAVVDGGRKFPAKKSWSTILWFITDCVSIRPATDAPANSISSFSTRLRPTTSPGAPQEISLALNQTVALDPDTSVQLVEFIPDFVVEDGRVYARSKDVVNPAVHMIVTSKKTAANSSVNVWLPPIARHRRKRILPLRL